MTDQIENTVDEATETATTKKDNIVTMNDGSSVNFNSRNKLIKVAGDIYTDAETGEEVAPLRINCVNGEFFIADIRAPAGTDHFLLQQARHGRSQKISDSVTKPENDADLAAGVARALAQLVAGVWTQNRGDGSGGLGDLIEAYIRLKARAAGVEVLPEAEAQALKATILAKDEAAIKLLKNNDRVKAVIAEIVAERAAAKAKTLGEKQSDAADVDPLDLLL